MLKARDAPGQVGYRMGYGLPASPADGLRLRRSTEATSRASTQRLAHGVTPREMGVPRSTNPGPSPQPQSASTIPPSPSRRTGRPQAWPRPPSESPSKSRGPANWAPEHRGSHIQSASWSTSPSPSCDGGRKAASSALKKTKPYHLSRDSSTLPRNSGSTSSPSPKRASQGQFKPATSSQSVRNAAQSPPQAEAVERVEPRNPSVQSPVIYPELDRYRDLQPPGRSADRRNVDAPHRLPAHDVPPQTPSSIFFSRSSSQVSAVSGSPSTRLSESPGPGPYSRDTTPTSTCSHSPILVAPSRLGEPSIGQLSNPSLNRPPVSWRRADDTPSEASGTSADPHGLASVRGSMTSSSSGSTVRAGDKNSKRERRPESRLSPLPPSPPGRKSSQKLPKSRFYSGTLREAREPGSTVRSAPKSEPSPPVRSPVSPGSGPPRRPSRDGTQDMSPRTLEPVSVIQSNISSIPRSFERHISESASFRSLPRSTTSLPQAGRSTSTPQLSTAREKALKAESTRSATEPKKPSHLGTSRSSQTSSPKVGASFSARFPFFGRKKPAPEAADEDKCEVTRQKKAGRKGPVAGTGHEGYGRFGAVRRRSSSGSNIGKSVAVAEPQPTQPKSASRDSFLADRVHPVVIAGGEIVENQNTSTDLCSEGGRASPQRRPSSLLRVHSGRASLSRKASSRITRWPTVSSSDARDPSNLLHPQRGDNADGHTSKPSLAFRRSIQRLRSSPDNPIRLPQPIITDVPVSASPPLTSIDASIASDESHLQLQKEISRGSNDSYPAAKKPPKRGRLPRKWNLFGRSHSRLNVKENSEEVRAAVVAVDKKRVAYYAMVDSSEHEERKPEIENVLEGSTLPHDAAGPIGGRECDTWSPGEEERRIKAPSQPPSPCPGCASNDTEPPTSPTASHQTAGSEAGAGRPSRLPQVGRIPRVVPTRQDNVSSQAFSRPFRASGNAFPKVTLSVYDPEFIATGPTPPRSSSPMTDVNSGGPAAAGSEISCSSSECIAKLSPEVVLGERDFLALSPRQRSEGLTDSSSSDSRGVCLFADATAVIPEPNDPPDEDEVWDEYNDLLDEGAARRFMTSMLPGEDGPRIELRGGRPGKGRCIDATAVAADGGRASTCSNVHSRSTSGSGDLTERIHRAFRKHDSLSTMCTTCTTSADENPSLGERISHASPEDAPRAGANRLSSASDRTVFTDCSAVSSDDESPLAQVNLRVGSMTVSKWLTFGHVLFSDIRHELDLVDSAADRLSVLVIDGLGNDDWSFYAAETYPTASFYNLSPRAALPAELQCSPSSFPLSPPNHHQVQYMSHLDKFPFAPQSFNCLVYRFPVAAPESHYRNIINEARRVLRPGGFIELSVLDADLNSMGNRGRRAVRGLKERLHGEAAEMNLASTADLVLRLLGKAGFSNIRAARVGVPVASSITSPDTQRTGRGGRAAPKAAPSLADMMRDNSPMADESITKLVTRVGRWWYTRCYENAMGSPSDASIWSSRPLLAECEELGTSLKLMVCCARAPNRIPSF